jgi:transporter family protein
MRVILKEKWFWYSILCVLCWGGWALLSKLGSTEIPAEGMQFLFTIGTLPVVLVLLVMRRFHCGESRKGIFLATLMGVLAGVGGLALFAAYRTQGNTSVITAVTALYPMITVGLAILFLRERLNRVQFVGLGCAAIAIVILSS